MLCATIMCVVILRACRYRCSPGPVGQSTCLICMVSPNSPPPHSDCPFVARKVNYTVLTLITIIPSSDFDNRYDQIPCIDNLCHYYFIDVCHLVE